MVLLQYLFKLRAADDDDPPAAHSGLDREVEGQGAGGGGGGGTVLWKPGLRVFPW